MNQNTPIKTPITTAEAVAIREALLSEMGPDMDRAVKLLNNIGKNVELGIDPHRHFWDYCYTALNDEVDRVVNEAFEVVYPNEKHGDPDGENEKGEALIRPFIWQAVGDILKADKHPAVEADHNLAEGGEPTQ